MIRSRTILRRHLNDDLESVLLRDDGLPTPRPGVLLIHEFTGLDQATLAHGERLARAGYAVLAADFYGPANRPANHAEASRISHRFRDDRTLMRQRAAHCLEVLAGQPEADPTRLGALGMSFGGGAVLELARHGAPLRAAVSFYGYLNTPLPARPGDIRAKLLVLHGDQDKVVPLTDIPPFEREMAEAGADLELVRYADAGHGFANPSLAPDPSTGSAYDPEIAEEAWSKALEFLDRVLGEGPDLRHSGIKQGA